MAAYNVPLNGVTTSVTDDSLTLVTAAAGVGSRIYIYEYFVGGINGSSAMSSNALARSTGGTTPGGAITPTPLDSNSSATLGFSAYTTWGVGTQPTLGTAFVDMPTFQGQGGQYKFFAAPDRPIVVGSGAAALNLSFRCISAVSVINASFKIELP